MATLHFDVARLREDMALRGWEPKDLALRAGVANLTVYRFLRGERRTVKTCKKLADALGYTVRRYLIPSRMRVSA